MATDGKLIDQLAVGKVLKDTRDGHLMRVMSINEAWVMLEHQRGGLTEYQAVARQYLANQLNSYGWLFRGAGTANLTIMSSDVITLHVRVRATDYANATRLYKAGALKANPLTLALLEMSAYQLINNTVDQITLLQVTSGRRYSGPVPALLADYLAGFRNGRRVFEDHEFELVLESDGQEKAGR